MFGMLYLIVYGLIGYCIISNNNKKFIIITTFAFAMITLCFECIGDTISIIPSSILSRLDLYTAANRSAFGFMALIIVVLDMLSYKFVSENSTQQNIVINKELINFKDLLLFIESEYKTGTITVEEYNKKRNEILNKL